MIIIRVIGAIITLVGLSACTGFFVGYWYQTKGACWNTEAGRFLMSLMGTLGVLFGLGLLRPLIHPLWIGWRIFGLIVYLAFVLELWWPLRLLSQAQDARHRREQESRGRPLDGS